MGAYFQTMTVTETDPAAALAAFERAQIEDRAENGDEYTGGFGMCDRLSFKGDSFDSEEAANEWLIDHSHKFGPAVAVLLVDEVGKQIGWVIGANCAA